MTFKIHVMLCECEVSDLMICRSLDNYDRVSLIQLILKCRSTANSGECGRESGATPATRRWTMSEGAPADDARRVHPTEYTAGSDGACGGRCAHAGPGWAACACPTDAWDDAAPALSSAGFRAQRSGRSPLVQCAHISPFLVEPSFTFPHHIVARSASEICWANESHVLTLIWTSFWHWFSRTASRSARRPAKAGWMCRSLAHAIWTRKQVPPLIFYSIFTKKQWNYIIFFK